MYNNAAFIFGHQIAHFSSSNHESVNTFEKVRKVQKEKWLVSWWISVALNQVQWRNIKKFEMLNNLLDIMFGIEITLARNCNEYHILISQKDAFWEPKCTLVQMLPLCPLFTLWLMNSWPASLSWEKKYRAVLSPSIDFPDAFLNIPIYINSINMFWRNILACTVKQAKRQSFWMLKQEYLYRFSMFCWLTVLPLTSLNGKHF